MHLIIFSWKGVRRFHQAVNGVQDMKKRLRTPGLDRHCGPHSLLFDAYGGVICWVIRGQRCKVCHSPSYSTVVNSAWSHTSAPPCVRFKRNIFPEQSFVGFVVDEETMEQIFLKGTSVFLSVTLPMLHPHSSTVNTIHSYKVAASLNEH